MPGHNHYPDCTCGWCWKKRHTPQIYVRQDSVDKAKRFLSEYYVTERRQAACFVNPNANCPVCGARVYYYQNAYGSRVYFDDLGGDWPKHRCTDNRPMPATSGRSRVAPIEFVGRRTSSEIVSAARLAGIALNGTASRSNPSEHWVLARVTEVWVIGKRRIVIADRLDFDGLRRIAFACDDPTDLIEVDEIVSLGRANVSVLDPINFEKLVIPADIWDAPEE